MMASTEEETKFSVFLRVFFLKKIYKSNQQKKEKCVRKTIQIIKNNVKQQEWKIFLHILLEKVHKNKVEKKKNKKKLIQPEKKKLHDTLRHRMSSA